MVTWVILLAVLWRLFAVSGVLWPPHPRPLSPVSRGRRGDLWTVSGVWCLAFGVWRVADGSPRVCVMGGPCVGCPLRAGVSVVASHGLWR